MSRLDLLKWLARILSLVSIFVLGLFVFGGEESLRMASVREAIGFSFFPIGVVVGMLLGWKSEFLGGVFAIASLAAFYIWHFSSSSNLPSGPWFLIFALPGILFFVVGLMGHNKTKELRTPSSNEFHEPESSSV